MGAQESERAGTKAKCLNFHAAYRCHHSGACCRAGWTIPFSTDEFVSIGRLPLSANNFRRDEAGRVYAVKRSDGACALLDDSGLCAIHRLASAAALPVSCRMFPRVVLHDARGTFISLSHFCPTAASMLFAETGAVTIVDAPGALADVGELDGLNARNVWPPLLRPGVLMDLESYGVWEAKAIDLLTRDDRTATDALDTLGSVTAQIARWSPGERALRDAVDRAFEATDAAMQIFTPARPTKRWLAARLFANWVAYQGDGLCAIVRYLEACLETFNRELAVDANVLEAIRRADVAILHRSEG